MGGASETSITLENSQRSGIRNVRSAFPFIPTILTVTITWCRPEGLLTKPFKESSMGPRLSEAFDNFAFLITDVGLGAMAETMHKKVGLWKCSPSDPLVRLNTLCPYFTMCPLS